MTAWQAVERAAVAAGSRVLVLGASGGVGHFTVPLLADRGAAREALAHIDAGHTVGKIVVTVP